MIATDVQRRFSLFLIGWELQSHDGSVISSLVECVSLLFPSGPLLT